MLGVCRCQGIVLLLEFKKEVLAMVQAKRLCCQTWKLHSMGK